MKKRLSIVIPAYNAERTINKVVESVTKALGALREESEIVVVNDGSTDGTREVLNVIPPRLEQGKVSVRSLHQENGGCYRARLAGLRTIDSEYFGFVDADDFVEPEMYVDMLSIAESENADVVECGWRLEGVSLRDSRPCEVVERLLSKEMVRENYILPNLVGCGASAYLWNKIYRNQYEFASWIDGDFGSYEDLIHNLQLFTKVRSFVRLSNKFYRYAPTDTSVTKTFNYQHILRLRNTAKAKSELIRAYVPETNVDIAMRMWLANEKKNYMKKAIIASHGNLSVMIKNLAQIFKVRV